MRAAAHRPARPGHVHAQHLAGDAGGTAARAHQHAGGAGAHEVRADWYDVHPPTSTGSS